MATTIIRVSRQKTEELKGMISEGLNIFGRAMSLAEEMCESSEMGERMGQRMGMRDEFGMGERMGERMSERIPYEEDPYAERRGVRGTGRYSRY